MFCSECGTKNKKGDAFCSECGHKLEVEEKETKEEKKTTRKEEKKETPKEEKQPVEKKPLSKKKKGLIAVIIILAVALGVGYKYASDITSPKHIADEYIKAVINNDANKLYSYLEIKGDKTFVTKNIFKKVMTKATTEKIKNYKIKSVEKKDLIAEVKFTYMTKDSTSEHTGTIKLTKEKGKEYFIFDKWKVADISTDEVITEDYSIKVTKGSTLTYAGVKVTDKYLDEDKSDENYDVYVLPQVFRYETEVTAKLPNGITVTNKVTPSSYYNSTTIKFDKDSLTEKQKKEILKVSKEGLEDIYGCAIDMLEFDRIQKKFEHKGLDLTNLEESFTEFKSDLLSSSNKLLSIEFKDMDIYDIDIDEDGNYVVEVKSKLNYKVSYSTYYSNETKEATSSAYGYMKVILKYMDKNYYVYDVDNLKTYFSRY